jgi:hypothetical protein
MSFLQSTETNLKSGKSETVRISCAGVTPPGLHSAGALHAERLLSTATMGTPGPERASKLQRRLISEPKGDSELKKIEEKFKWLHSQNRRDAKGRSATVCVAAMPHDIAVLPHDMFCWCLRQQLESSLTNNTVCRTRHMTVPEPFRSQRLRGPSSLVVRSSTGK